MPNSGSEQRRTGCKTAFWLQEYGRPEKWMTRGHLVDTALGHLVDTGLGPREKRMTSSKTAFWLQEYCIWRFGGAARERAYKRQNSVLEAD